MPLNTTQTQALFFSGIHMDIMCNLSASSTNGASNPADISKMAGGASLNTASISTQLGIQCGIIGLTGDDTDAKSIVETLKRRQINNLLEDRAGALTGSYISVVEPDGELKLAVNDLKLNEQMNAKWLTETYGTQLQRADLWFLNSNLSAHTLAQLSDRKHSKRPKLVTAASISVAKSVNLAPSLGNIDVLFTNISEARALLGKSEEISAQACIEEFRKLGIEQGSLSQGAEDLWVWEKDQCYCFTPREINNKIDVIGAGDALAGVFIWGLLSNKSLIDSAPIAIAAAQLIICTKGPYCPNINLQELQSRATHIRSKSA